MGKNSLSSMRTRARTFALQAIYQYLMGGGSSIEVDTHTRELIGFHKADFAYYQNLFYGCIEHAKVFDQQIEPLLDRSLAEVSVIERSILWLGLYELTECLDTPYRVVLNEYIELAKRFGGTDGHRFINGILHKLAEKKRAYEG